MEHTQVIHDIQKSLLAMQDLSYRDFQVKLMPTVDKETVIGVRTPQLRSFAKAFASELRNNDGYRDPLADPSLPHRLVN